MAYGVSVKNNNQTVILGEDVVPMMVDPSDPVSVTEYDRIYRPPEKAGGLPMFLMSSGINQFDVRAESSFQDPWLYPSGYQFEFNNRANIGAQDFRYLLLGDAVQFPSGGFGVEIRNGQGQITYNSNGFLFQPEELLILRYGQTVTIPNGKWICCPAWRFLSNASGFYVTGSVERQGSTNQWNVTQSDSSPPSGTLMGVILTVTI